MEETVHIPVMLEESIEHLNIHAGCWYLDATFGQGGYTNAILQQKGNVLALDRDLSALKSATEFEQRYPHSSNNVAQNGNMHDPSFVFEHSSFVDMSTMAKQHGISFFDGIVMDLGVSSPQLDMPERGFSFQKDGRLDMRMDRTGARDAHQIVNFDSEESLSNIFYNYGEERQSRRIAHSIVRARENGLIETTLQLSQIICRAINRSDNSGTHRARKHPATKVFQALRIAVNDELNQLEMGLEATLDLLHSGARLVVVSFHSLEDRIVKRFMRKHGTQLAKGSRHHPEAIEYEVPRMKEKFKIITNKPIKASEAEVAKNIRSRSACMRVVEKI